MPVKEIIVDEDEENQFMLKLCRRTEKMLDRLNIEIKPNIDDMIEYYVHFSKNQDIGMREHLSSSSPT